MIHSHVSFLILLSSQSLPIITSNNKYFATTICNIPDIPVGLIEAYPLEQCIQYNQYYAKFSEDSSITINYEGLGFDVMVVNIAQYDNPSCSDIPFFVQPLYYPIECNDNAILNGYIQYGHYISDIPDSGGLSGAILQKKYNTGCTGTLNSFTFTPISTCNNGVRYSCSPETTSSIDVIYYIDGQCSTETERFLAKYTTGLCNSGVIWECLPNTVLNPTTAPVTDPTSQPSALPSREPSSSKPTIKPRSTSPTTRKPSPTLSSLKPTIKPSYLPSSKPLTKAPSMKPVTFPPSKLPSSLFSSKPLSRIPSVRPSLKPSSKPSLKPSSKPSLKPSSKPSLKPSSKPSLKPSSKPSLKPSSKPSLKASSKPSLKPSSKPSLKASSKPSPFPTTRMPTRKPTLKVTGL